MNNFMHNVFPAPTPTPTPSSTKEVKNLSELPELIKAVLYTILGFLIISEVINFIKLRGFEHPIGYCLFKLLSFCFCFLLLKSSDSAMLLVLNHLKELNETMCVRLEEIQKNQQKNKKEEE